MTIKKMLELGIKKLKDTAFARLDAEVLLCDILKKQRAYLFTYPEKMLTASQEKKYKNYLNRRAHYEPIAYITGHKEFYGFDFLISPAVLIPRPETELIIDIAKQTLHDPTSNSLIIDIGTGSGAIAITLKKLFPKINVLGIDISASALKIARQNSKHLKANVKFAKTNLLNVESPTLYIKKDLIITANLPYLSTSEWQKLTTNVKKYEPKSALVGGTRGIELYEKLFKQLNKLCRESDSLHITLIIEIGARQKKSIEKIARQILKPKKIEFYKDLANKWRAVKIIL